MRQGRRPQPSGMTEGRGGGGRHAARNGDLQSPAAAESAARGVSVCVCAGDSRRTASGTARRERRFRVTVDATGRRDGLSAAAGGAGREPLHTAETLEA